MFKRIIWIMVLAFVFTAGVSAFHSATAAPGVPASCSFKHVTNGYSQYGDDELVINLDEGPRDTFRVSYCLRMNGRLKLYKAVGNTAWERYELKKLARGFTGTGFNRILCEQGDRTVYLDMKAQMVGGSFNGFHDRNWNKWTKRFVMRNAGCYIVK